MPSSVKIINLCDAGKGAEERPQSSGRLKGMARLAANSVVSSCYGVVTPSFPLAIEVETINRCNNNCSFCPVNISTDPRAFGLMDMALIEKIATELGRVNYSGLLALFSNNEPLLDERIVDICALFRNRVKGAHIYLYTNGIRITPELYLNLFRAGLDEMIIDNYSEKGELIAPVRVLLDEISENGKEADTYKKKTRIFIRRKKEVLTNRGGSAPNKTGTSDKGYLRLQKTSCALPFMQMVIRPTGEVSLCCQDALGKVTLGDVSRETIAGVWNGKAFIDARTRLRMFGRGSVRLCSLCDVSIIYTAVIKRKLFGLLPFSRRGFRL